MINFPHGLRRFPFATLALLLAGCGGDGVAWRTWIDEPAASAAAQPTVARTSINFAQAVLDEMYAEELAVNPFYDDICAHWRLFEPAGLEGQDSTAHDQMGVGLTMFKRRCGNSTQVVGVATPLPYDASQHSVSQPLTTSSTSSGMRRLTTVNTVRPDGMGLRDTRRSTTVRGMKRNRATHLVIGRSCSTPTPSLFTKMPTDTGSKNGSPSVRR